MALMQGSLLKWTNVMKGYQLRWFVLDEINGLLSYYTSSEKLVRGDRRGCIRLKDAIIGIEDEDDTLFSITLTSENKVFHFKAHSAKERDKWVNGLCDFIQLYQRRRRRRLKYSAEANNTNNKNPVEQLEQFNKKLIEADVYLQILIKQLKKLDSKIIKENNSLPEYIQQQQNRLHSLKDRLGLFLDSIKHTIVLLQISKNIKFPENVIFPNDSYNHKNHHVEYVGHVNSKNETNENVSNLEMKTQSNISDSDANTKTTCDLDMDVDNVNRKKDDNFIKYMTTNETNLNERHYNKMNRASDVSYSSSDDENDCYFDANDESNTLSDFEEAFTVDVFSAQDASNDSKSNTIDVTKKSFDTIDLISTNEMNYDNLYESDDDDSVDDLRSIASHGSVISHLIAQVKIGMDLTKVALPTFILERRSLLEMYADFFAHADTFVSIPDYKTPKERMIQVTKWYLSAFHAGRKGSIAKKPYNPILGEVFKCYWSLSKKDLVTCDEGPMPWAKTSDLIFVAEQVSHHPPVSAFYTECVNKRIMCCAHIWTKSKFLGLSIGVNNIGKGTIYLLDHEEEYTCTFPSAYGRSILTEPWFELGGNVKIECEKSGYTAKIDFLPKPFYGGKKHRINAEIFDPNKKSIVTITGEWNGKMEAKWVNSSGKPKLFIDTKTMPIIKKQVKPINEQEDFESRKLWKNVTLALKKQDVNEATTAKYNIEQQQRDLVKEREEKAIKWQNRMFHNLGEKWSFNNPLTDRKPKR